MSSFLILVDHRTSVFTFYFSRKGLRRFYQQGRNKARVFLGRVVHILSILPTYLPTYQGRAEQNSRAGQATGQAGKLLMIVCISI